MKKDDAENQQKRSRLAECVKGVAKIIALPRILKHFRWGAVNRLELVKMLCGTKKMLQLLPQEECTKFLHYVNFIFLSYIDAIYSSTQYREKSDGT